MVDKNLRFAILDQARKTLEQGKLSSVEKDELLKILDLLILSLKKHSPPDEWENDSRTLAENLISSHALLALVTDEGDCQTIAASNVDVSLISGVKASELSNTIEVLLLEDCPS